ncbi:hypothetical protein [Bifidobacterium sp. M0353]|uniref:hypothetical protein n=1 Tax=Bifidobacterium sp. M0353 TaxID=2751006 RepID=UPI0018DE2318|nr:hypothetical protein [Bifidobacterium sp. M0353]MBI0150319.1 hypothetical protein [Bifidobacterium sp. M0353]
MTGAKYAPGRMDESANRVRDQRRLEREKREANRPTGTEIAQVTRRLDEQQERIMRTTPVFSTVSGSSPGASLGGGWTRLVSVHAARDTSHGKRNAVLLISVTAAKTGDGMPLLKCLAGGAAAGTFPGVTANGDDFGGSSSTMVDRDVDVVLYGRSTVSGASPVGSVSMTVTVISLA